MDDRRLRNLEQSQISTVKAKTFQISKSANIKCQTTIDRTKSGFVLSDFSLTLDFAFLVVLSLFNIIRLSNPLLALSIVVWHFIFADNNADFGERQLSISDKQVDKLLRKGGKGFQMSGLEERKKFLKKFNRIHYRWDRSESRIKISKPLPIAIQQ